MDFLVMVILAIAIALTFMAIIKKFNATVTLFVSGLILIAVAYVCGFGTGELPLKKPSGFLMVDLFKIITEVFKSTFNGLGLYILTIGGFAYFIEKVGSGRTLVYYAIRPLKKFNSPYLVLTLAFYLGVVLNIFIDSAAGLGLLLATTIYPILRGLGISKVAAASVISTTGSFALGPLSSIGALNAELLNLQLHEYFFNYKIYTSVGVVLFAGIVHYFWQKRADAKDALVANGTDEVDEYVENADLKPGHPLLAFIPIIPVLIMFIPIMNKNIKMDIATVMFCTMMISIILIGIVNKMSIKGMFDMLGEFFTGMSKILSVVILIVAGQIFAQGLISMGAVTYLVHIGNSLQIGGMGMSFIFSACSFLLAAMIGSGNAAIIAFANLSPDVATQFSVPLIKFLVPMHDIAILGRPLAPVAGVIIAVAGIVKVDVIALVKRNFVPMISTAIFAFIFDMFILSIIVK